jgi:acyl carrier protein
MSARLVDLMSTVFEVNEKEINSKFVFGRHPKWDSLKHMTLLVALEDEFNVTFSADESVDMLSYDLIVSILSEKLGKENLS